VTGNTEQVEKSVVIPGRGTAAWARRGGDGKQEAEHKTNLVQMFWFVKGIAVGGGSGLVSQWGEGKFFIVDRRYVEGLRLPAGGIGRINITG
jgi:hypothetical protein